MTPLAPVFYVYGVVPSAFEVGRSPTGLDDAPLRLVRHAALAALISELDAEHYTAPALERNTEDVDWLAPRAVAHDRVLTWASDRGAVVPLPMFSLFSGEGAVCAMLQERAAQLDAALQRASEGREYALRVYRVDAELNNVAAELSPRLAEMERTANAASPGQRYLLQRKLETERKSEVRSISQRVARELFAALTPHAIAAREDPAPRASGSGPGAEAALVLDAAFLVSTSSFDSFQRELTTLVSRHEGRGFRFDFTGPWPAYHFVQDVSEESSRGS